MKELRLKLVRRFEFFLGLLIEMRNNLGQKYFMVDQDLCQIA